MKKGKISDYAQYSDLKLNYRTISKKRFLYYTSFTAIIIFTFFFIYHYFIDKNLTMSFSMLIGAIGFGINLLLLYKTNKLELSINIGLIISMILFSITYVNGGIKNIGLYWMLIFPVMAYFYKGRKRGTYFLAFFIIILLVLFILKQMNIITTPYSNVNFFMLLSVFLFISVLTYFYEETAVKSEEVIKKQIYTNILTGLPNRTKLLEDLENAKKLILMLINIDDFKHINDLYGTRVGDQTIVELGNRLKQLFGKKPNYKIYKLHADEFAVLILKKISKAKVEKIAHEIQNLLSRKIFINNIEIIVQLSLGIAEGSYNILMASDMALKLAKEKRRDFVFFDKKLKIAEKYKNNLKWMNIIEKALASDNFIPYYQPIINNSNRRIEKYECLIRMINDGKVISPFYFLEIAKRSKLYHHITKIVVMKSIETFKDSVYNFSINLCVDDILNENTVEFITGLIKDYNIAKKIIFEIVESERIETDETVNKFIYDMKKLGCGIAIDDFGTGYSNFEYALRMNIDFIKIDASLIKNIDKDKNSQIITETIVDFTKRLNIKTIAEFVHSKSVFDKVRELEIDYSQGYYLENLRR